MLETARDRNVKRIAGLLVLFLLIAGTALLTAAPSTITWKPLDLAILTLDGKAPKTWNAYRAEKHDAWILVKLWRRYLFLDLREQVVYDIDPQKLKPKGDAFEWSEADRPSTPVAISGWDARSVGPMRRIRFKFGANGSILEIQLPQKPDLRPFY
ncbi:MAG: hypothetical protein ABSF92_06530 [Candidatus Acidiferrales bacterium]|jgi:hypothetical protein